MVSFSGLRGAVGLALVLIINKSGTMADNEDALSIMDLEVSGIVLFTLLINGSTVGLLYKELNIYPTSEFLDKLMNIALKRLQRKMDNVRAVVVVMVVMMLMVVMMVMVMVVV